VGAAGNLLLLGLHRTGFALALGWLLLASLYPAGLARPLARFLGLRLWIGIAKVSYSLYLIHIFVIGWVLAWARPWLSVPGHDFGLMLGILAIAALVGLALASLSYALVEKPGIDAGKRLLARSRSGALP
jgi:peptidoglycan/LPS O-acetylase OafA/YrhL